MSTPIDTLLARLPDARQTGPGRWRCACPAHGGRNKSTLSIGAAENGAVLLKCWHGCAADEVASALGLELSALFPAAARTGPGGGAGPLKKRALLSARQALDLLHDEAQVIGVCAANIARGIELTHDDKARVLTAAGRVAYLRGEVMA